MTEDRSTEEGRGRAWTTPEKAAAAAVGVNALLTLLKFGLAWWSNSLSLKVEAFHSFADIGSSLAVLIAVRSEMVSRASGDAGEEAGSGRAAIFKRPQLLVSIFIGLFLAFVGVWFLSKVIYPEPIIVRNPVPVALTMLLLALFSFLLSRLERVVGEREGCTGLVADSFHARVDMFGSLVVAGALLGESLGMSLDRAAAGLLAVFILTQAVNVFGAVIRDLARGEAQEDHLYRDWLWLAIQKRLPGIIPRLVTLVTRLMGKSPESEADRRKAGAVMIGISFGAALILYLFTGLFTVQANEKAIVEHLGKPKNLDRPLGPGLHWRWPWPFDKVRKVDVTGIKRLNVGSVVAPDRRTVLWTNQHYVEQFNILSGENIFVDIGIVLHYRTPNPAAWLYRTQDPEALLQSITYAVLTEEFSRLRFLETITSGREELEKMLTDEVRDSIGEYQTGASILYLQIRDAHPPTNVAPDFEEVVSATIEYETKINEARGYTNDLIPRARGEAAIMVAGARAERAAAENRARGDAERFNRMRQAYSQRPSVTRSRLRIEAAEAALPGREKIIVPAGASSDAIELFLTANPGRVPGSR